MLTNYVCVGGCKEIIVSICVSDHSLVLQKYPLDQNWITGWWVIANGQMVALMHTSYKNVVCWNMWEGAIPPPLG